MRCKSGCDSGCSTPSRSAEQGSMETTAGTSGCMPAKQELEEDKLAS